MQQLIVKIEDKAAWIGIVGLGYTGLPLALTFAEKFTVIGYDTSKGVIIRLLNGDSPIGDVKAKDLREYLGKAFLPTSSYQELGKCDFIIICVSTPLTVEKEPDLSFVRDACETIAKILRKGHFIILESTTYPGTTEEVVIPVLERGGLKVGSDFGVAYSPERIDPGNKRYTIKNTPKVVGGINQECTEIASTLYRSIISSVVEVKDCQTAEAVKMVENIFRNVNIALVNELALIFEKMGIDIWQVIRAASTKPYGFMPFYPGPGIGGHCIPLDPYYMSYKAKKFDFIPRFIELSGQINEFMKTHALNLVEKSLEKVGKRICNSRIAVMGLAYKKEIADTRESPARTIIEQIVNLGGRVKVYDPYARMIETNCGKFNSESSIEAALQDADCAVFVTDHTEFRNMESDKLTQSDMVIVDCRNIFAHKKLDKTRYCGIGIPENR